MHYSANQIRTNNTNDPPKWVCRGAIPVTDHPDCQDVHLAVVECKYCPACGKKVPNIIKKKSANRKIMEVTDGGYYCNTCTKRLNECSCLPPEADWQPIENFA